MKKIKFLLLPTVILILTACGNQNSKQDSSDLEETTAQGNIRDYTEIIVDGYRCGDNCYLEYYENKPNATKKTAICLADECGEWEKSGNLPKRLKNITVLAKFSKTRQYDGAGNIMNEDYPAITDLIIPKDKTRNKEADKSGNNEISKEDFLQKLQGNWKRQSYPYGTIEFKADQVKFNTGEGNANPPKFKSFELNRNCTTSESNLNASDYDFWVVTENNNCDAIKLTSNSFEIYFAGNKQSVLYKRVGAKNDIDFSQSKNLPGKVLPLEPGFYVLVNSDCKNPANASWRYWNGVGLSGSSTKSCKMKLIKKDDNNFIVSQICTNTYDQNKSTTEFTVEVSDVNNFTLIENGQSQNFKFCNSTPSWLKM